MSSVPDRSTFETAYTGQAPWDIGRPQQAFLAVANRITGSILDAGCGTGENALFFATRTSKPHVRSSRHRLSAASLLSSTTRTRKAGALTSAAPRCCSRPNPGPGCRLGAPSRGDTICWMRGKLHAGVSPQATGKASSGITPRAGPHELLDRAGAPGV